MFENDYKSEQAAKVLGVGYSQLRPIDHYGRRRVHFFNYTVPEGVTVVAGEKLVAVKLPVGTRILGGKLATGGLIPQTGAVYVGLAAADGSGFLDKAGTVPDDDTFLSTISGPFTLDSANGYPFAITGQENYGYVLEKACFVVLAVVSGTFIAGAEILGDLEIVVD